LVQLIKNNMLIDIEQEDNTLTVSYINKEGNTDYKTYQFDNFRNWYVTNESDRYKSKDKRNWDDRPVKAGKARSMNKFSIYNFLETLSPEDDEEIFAFNLPKTYFVDIETEVVDGFPSPLKAETKILTISIITPDNKAIVLGTKDVPNNEKIEIEGKINNYFSKLNDEFDVKWEFKYFKFNSEYDLLYTFLSKFVKQFPVISGWNYVFFDWTYIINRAKRIGIDPSISSPTGKLTRQNFPMHITIYDYMDLYANWDRSIKIKENAKLETASNAVLGLGKIKYDGQLQELYESDFSRYIYYNAVDSILVYFIHRRLKTMDIAFTLANMCRISVYKASSPVVITESYLSRNFLKMNKVLAQDKFDENKHEKDTKFQGAFVKEPIKGFHKAVACFDYASLYPSLMRLANISPDSFIEKIPQSQVEEERKKGDKSKIITASGAVYGIETSILKQVLTNLYSQRKEYKATMFEHKMNISKIKDALKK